VLFRRSCSRLLLLTLALGVSGCGLSDYESKMLEQQQRVQRWDAENKLLGKPLDIKYPEKDAAPAVFLRAPKEIGTQAPEELRDGWRAVYLRQGNTGLFKSVCVNVYLRADLENDLLRVFPHPAQVPATNRSTQSGVALRQWSWEEGTSAYVVLLYPATKPTTAVVYEYERGKNVQEALTLSADTLAVGGEALKQRGEFARRGQRR
jgi:hypothetical protein